MFEGTRKSGNAAPFSSRENRSFASRLTSTFHWASRRCPAMPLSAPIIASSLVAVCGSAARYWKSRSRSERSLLPLGDNSFAVLATHSPDIPVR